MKMRFTLNAAEYAGVSGLVNCGKTIVNLAEDVKDGIYESEKPFEQQMLAELRGKNGRVFRSEIVNPDGSTSEVKLEPVPIKTVGRNPAEVAAQLELQQQRRAPEVPHPDASGYEALPEAELKKLIQGKGLPVPTDTDKAGLIDILDQADAQKSA